MNAPGNRIFVGLRRYAPWGVAQRSLRIKLGLVVLLGMACMALALGMLILSTANGLFLNQARAELLRRNQGVAANIDGLTERAAQALVLARQDPAFDAFYTARPGTPERTAALQVIQSQVRTLQKLFAVDEICLINASGAEDVRGVGGVLTRSDQLSQDETSNPFFGSALALQDGQVYRSMQPYISEDSGDWAVAHATPVVLAEGTHAAVLHFEIPLDWFAATLGGPSDDGGYSFLITRDGHLLLHPGLPGEPSRAEGDHAFPHVESWGSDEFRAVASRMMAGAAGSGTYRDGDETYEVVYRPVFDGKWVVGTVLPYSTIFAPSAELVRRTLVLAVPLLVLALAAMGWYGTRFLAPLQRLADALRAAGEGDLGKEIGDGSPDEIGQLGRAFDRMAHALRATSARKAAAERDVAQARDEALAALRSKSEFLATMSHEIRTPLNAVIGMTHLLLETDLHADQREHAEAVYNAGESLLVLLNDVLDFSKMEAGRLDVEALPCSVVDVVQDAVGLLARAARDKEILVNSRVALNVPDDLLGDEPRLRQVLINLISNAVKFTESGSIDVCAACVEESPASVVLRFEVRDSGVGISTEAQRRLFEPFVQADSSTTRRYGGTGLGLAICRRLVQAFGGEIGVNSEPGHGSCFWFTACFAKADGRAVKRLESAPPAPSLGGEEPGSGLRLLVVEDSTVNQRVLLGHLKSLGYAADAVDSGQAALEACARHRYAAVLMDCQMPDLDGYQTTTALRRREIAGHLERTPVIAVTAGALPGDRERCVAAGMDDFVAKPVRRAALEAVLACWTVSPEILGIFVDEAPLRLGALRRATAAGCWDDARRAAHQLGSECALVGAHELASLCRIVETMPDDAAIDVCAQQLAQLGTLLERLLGDLPQVAGRSNE